MEKKFIYEAPETELIDLKLEQGILLESTQAGVRGEAGAKDRIQEYDDDF